MTDNESPSLSVLYSSCFISEVEMNSTDISLIGTNHVSYHIDKSNVTLREKFKMWFKLCYLKAIPHQMTIIKHHVEMKDDEPVMIVDDILSWTGMNG